MSKIGDVVFTYGKSWVKDTKDSPCKWVNFNAHDICEADHMTHLKCAKDFQWLVKNGVKQ